VPVPDRDGNYRDSPGSTFIGAERADKANVTDFPNCVDGVLGGYKLCTSRCARRSLDANRTPLYIRRHEYRRDHCHRSPLPPYHSGTGRRLRLDISLCRRIRSAASPFSCSAI
jgi:hypothetical protein